jgi:hypothetical protein
MVQFFDPTQEAEIKRRRRMAEMLMQQNAPKQTEMVGGFAVPQSGLQGLSNAFGSVLGAYAGGTADEKEQELVKQRQELMAKAIQQLGSDPKAAAGLMMQDPSMMAQGLSVYGEAMKNDRAAMEADREYARKDLEFQREADLKRELLRMRGQGGGGQPVLDALGEPLLDANGDAVMTEAPRKLSATEQKSFEAQQEKINALESSQDAFNQIKGYQSKPMFSGAGAESLAFLNRVPVVGALINDEKASNTTAYQNLIKTGQYKQLASTFPGAISNSEREALEKLGAIASYTPLEQAKIVRDAETGLSKLLEKAKQRASDIASGKQYEKAIAGEGSASSNIGADGRTLPPINQDPRIAAAKAAGYTDAEIEQYLKGR